MEFVIVERKDNVAVVTINRPKQLNALNTAVYEDLDRAFEEVAAMEGVYAVVLTGAGEKSFVAGADIAEMKDLDVKGGKHFGNNGNNICRKIENFKYPVIAAVNGYCLGGGCELAMCCDIRIASENARFAQPEVGLGITPGCGGTQRLARLVGPAIAKEMIYTCRQVKAPEALAIGLVNKVVPLENLMEEALAMAAAIAKNAPIAVSLCKELINTGAQCDLDTALKMEANAFAQCFATEDQKEAMTAFVNKSKVDHFNNR